MRTRRNDRERRRAPLRDAAAGKSEVTAVAVVGRRNDAGGEVHQKPDFN